MYEVGMFSMNEPSIQRFLLRMKKVMYKWKLKEKVRKWLLVSLPGSFFFAFVMYEYPCFVFTLLVSIIYETILDMQLLRAFSHMGVANEL